MRFLFADRSLPNLDDGRPFGSSVFSSAASVPARRGRQSMTYGTQGVHWEGVCLMGGGGTWSTTASGLRRSRRRAGEHGQRKRARALVDHGETMRIPGWAGDQVEEAVDDGGELGWLR
jgi:hypothetical protein